MAVYCDAHRDNRLSMIIEDFPEHMVVPPDEVRAGLYEGRPYYQCEHMSDIAILPNGKWHIINTDPY